MASDIRPLPSISSREGTLMPSLSFTQKLYPLILELDSRKPIDVAAI